MAKIPLELRAEVERWRSFERERPAHIVPPGPGQGSVWDYPRPSRDQNGGKRSDGECYLTARDTSSHRRLAPQPHSGYDVEGVILGEGGRLEAAQTAKSTPLDVEGSSGLASFIESANNLATDG